MKTDSSAPQGMFKKQVSDSLRQAMQKHGLSVSMLALRVGTGRTAIRRILDPENTSFTFHSLCKVAAAVGLQLKFVATPLPPKTLGKMAARLANSSSQAEAQTLSKEILAGFYGRPDASYSKKKSSKGVARPSAHKNSRKDEASKGQRMPTQLKINRALQRSTRKS